MVGALALCAEGKSAECIEGLHRPPPCARTRPRSTSSRPGPLVPARELLAEMLLDARSRFADALREYEAVMAKEPNRYRTLAGAMAAAQGRAIPPRR